MAGGGLPRNDRALSLDEAMSIALALQQSEQWAAAADVYSSILDVAPDHAGALHFSGVLAHQQARSEEAVTLIRRSLELEPERADWHSNLGIVLQDRLELDDAVVAYERAIALEPEHANAHNNLGVVLRAKGKAEEAEEQYRVAIRIDPEHSDAYNNLGVLLNGQKRAHEAAVCFSKVITLRPKHPEARRMLALAHCTLGEVDKAVRVFEEWLQEAPDDPIAQHMLAACSGRDVPPRASDAFVEQTFDSFAASFDSKLAKLAYRAPALVAGMLAKSSGDASKSFDVLARMAVAAVVADGVPLSGPGVAQLLHGEDEASAGTQRVRRRHNHVLERSKIHERVCRDDHIERRDAVACVGGQFTLDELVVESPLAGVRKHACGQVDSDEAPRIRRDERPAQAGTATGIEHIEALRRFDRRARQHLRNQRGGAVQQFLELGIEAGGEAVEGLFDEPV